MGPPSQASPLSSREVAWQVALSRPLPPSPASMSPGRPGKGPAWKPAARPQTAHPTLSVERLPETPQRETPVDDWEESDVEGWDSESFESTLSSIAAFDMDGALDRMASGDRFYTPEAAGSSPMANFNGVVPTADELMRFPCHSGDQLEGSLQEEADRADTRPALVLSSDSNDSPQVVAWTAGRSMNRRHILDSPESAGSQPGAQEADDAPLATGGCMRKLVLPGLDEALKDSAAQPSLTMHTLEHSTPEKAQTSTEIHSSAATDSLGAGLHENTGAPDKTDEIITIRPARRASRRAHVLDDSEDDDSPAIPQPADTWSGASPAGEVGSSGSSSSEEVLSSGLRSAVRQLGSSYRLVSAAAADIPLSGKPLNGRLTGQSNQASASKEEAQDFAQDAGSRGDVYELSDSEEASPQRTPLRELDSQTWEFQYPGKQEGALFQMGRAGKAPEPATPVWKGTARKDARVRFTMDGLSAQTLPPMPRNLPRVLNTPLRGEDLPSMPKTPKTAPSPFYPHTPSKSRPAKTPGTVAAFRKRRLQLAASAFQEFNSNVFDKRLPADLEIAWSAHLKTTAGTTHFRREAPIAPDAGPRYSAIVQLATKVIDSEAKLRATLLHELCHVATWLLPPHVAKPPHGPDFKRWVKAASKAYPALPVTTCHQYEIHVPFHYQCLNPECAFVYKRHSKSIDTDRMACGMCSGRLMFRGKFLPDGTPAKTRAPNAFSDFVKDHFAGIKAAHPAGTPHKALMTALSAKWRSQKASTEISSVSGCTDLGLDMASLRL